MSYELFAGLALFAFVSSITPGPNNLMLMASGANYGFRRTIPHMLGIGLGFTFMVLLVGAGLAQLFELLPATYTVLKAACIAYLVYLAWKIATAAQIGDAGKSGQPMTFFQAAAFQWVNPKGWAMALSAISVYAPDQSLLAVALVSLVFGAINLPCVSTWTVLGQQLARWLTEPRRLAQFNWAMAGLLLMSMIPLI